MPFGLATNIYFVLRVGSAAFIFFVRCENK